MLPLSPIKNSMGSFYSTCSVTGMTLTHQRVARLLLVPSAYYSDYDSRNIFKDPGLVVSNEGAQALFSPFGFAIYGTYYDYGQIADIVEDRNVKNLEDFFGLSIEQIFDIAAGSASKNDETDPEKLEILSRLTYTDIRAEIYEWLCKKQDRDPYWDIEKSIQRYFDTREKYQSDPDYVDLGNGIRSFIPTLCRDNFLKLLNIDRTWENEYREMYQFIVNLGSLHKLLLPSNYGSQDYNFEMLIKLNTLANKLMRHDSKH
jgi:hypothetical protein